jgi:hypothetical protein
VLLPARGKTTVVRLRKDKEDVVFSLKETQQNQRMR